MKKFLLTIYLLFFFFYTNAQFTATAVQAYGCGGVTIYAAAQGGTQPYSYNFEYITTSNIWLPIAGSNLPVNYISVGNPFSTKQLCRVRVLDVNNLEAQSSWFYVDPASYNVQQPPFDIGTNMYYSSSCNSTGNGVGFYPTSTFSGPQLINLRGPFNGYYKENGTSNWLSLGTSSMGYFYFTPPDSTKSYHLKIRSYCGNEKTTAVSWQTPTAYFTSFSEPTGCDANGIINIAGSGIGPLSFSLIRTYYDTGNGKTAPVQKFDTLPFQSGTTFNNLVAGVYTPLAKDGCGNIGFGSPLGNGNSYPNRFGIKPPYPKFPFPTNGPTPCTQKIIIEVDSSFPGVPPLQYGIQLNPGQTMQWQSSPEFILTDGTYMFSIKDACGRSVYWHQRDISVAHPSISQTTIGAEACGRSVTIGTTGTPAGMLTFGLERNNGMVPPEIIRQSSNVFHLVPSDSWIPFIEDDCGRYNGITFNLSDPQVIITVSPYNNIAAGQSATFTATLINGGANPQFQWMKDGVDIAGAISATYVSGSPTAGAYTCRVTNFLNCSNTPPFEVSSNSIALSVYSDLAAPCTPTFAYPFNNNPHCITYVGLGAIQNYSGCDGNGFHAYTNLSTNASIGSTQSITLTTGNGYYGISCSVFVDYNGDGDFDDADEIVIGNESIAQNSSITRTFVIPSTARPGHSVMRVVSDYFAYGSLNPCFSNLGEVEDYVINIQSFGTLCTPYNDNPCTNININNVTMNDLNNSSGCNGGYSDYSNNKVVEAVVGGVVNYSITSGGQYYNNGKVSVYVDLDKNGTLDAGEMVVDNVDFFGNTPVTGTFNLPPGIALGDYRMRVLMDVPNVTGSIDPCHLNFGEAEDYTLSVVPFVYCHNVTDACTYGYISNVSIGSMANSSTCGSNGYSNFTRTLLVNATAGQMIGYSIRGADFANNYYNGYATIFIDYNNNGDFDDAGENVLNSNGLVSSGSNYGFGTFTIPTALAPGKYRIRVALNAGYNAVGAIDPCNVQTEVEDYTLNVQGSPIVYCVPTPSNTCFASYITNVKIGNINNSSICSSSAQGYSDYSVSSQTNVTPGQIINFSLSGDGNYNDYFAKIYVDFDGDGSFLSNAAEKVAEISIAGTTPAIGSFTIPASLSAGNYRLRVICDVNSLANNIDACTLYNGEAEDYTLVVPNCSIGQGIDVSGNSITITADNSPGTANGTDFGNVELGTTVSKTFVIKNNGLQAIRIYGTGLENTSRIQNNIPNGGIQYFGITAIPNDLLIPGASTTVTVQFKAPLDYEPYSPSLKNVILRIISNDCKESNYYVPLQANVTCPVNGPELDVFGNNVFIANNNSTISITDSTDMGIVLLGSSIQRRFTIRNNGNTTLNIGSTNITSYISGGQLTLVTTPASQISAGGSSEFIVRFSPTSAGPAQEVIYIYSNDCNESLFQFRVGGTGRSCTSPSTPRLITGATDICTSMSSATYSVAAVNGASLYKWAIPAGCTFINPVIGVYGPFNDTVLTTSNSITISFPPAYSTGSVAVAALNNCSQSTFRRLTVRKIIPVIPGSITLDNDILSAICSNQTVTCTITPVANAEGYLWKVPAGCTIVDAGTGGIIISQTTGDSAVTVGNTSTRIKVIFPPSFTSGRFFVQSYRQCLSLEKSNTRQFLARKVIAILPASLSGATNICSNILGGTESVYTVTPATTGISPTGYKWTVTGTGALITSVNGTAVTPSTSVTTGPTELTIGVTYQSNYTTGTLSVKAATGCELSTLARTITIRKIPIPPILSGPSSICLNTNNDYAITSPLTGIASFSWSKPSNASIVAGSLTGSASPVITLKWNSANSGFVSVKSVSACGTSLASNIISITPSCKISTDGIVSKSNNLTINDVAIFPNPSTGIFRLQIGKRSDVNNDVIITSESGVVLQRRTINNIERNTAVQFNLQQQPPGVYFVKIINSKEVITKKLVINH